MFMTSPMVSIWEENQRPQKVMKSWSDYGARVLVNELLDEYEMLCKHFDERRIDYTDGKSDFEDVLMKILRRVEKGF